VPAFTHISVLVVPRLRMAVGADQPYIIECVVRRITVFVVHLKRRGPAHPLGYATDFATMAAFLQQVSL
jgi:hypothetical protein